MKGMVLETTVLYRSEDSDEVVGFKKEWVPSKNNPFIKKEPTVSEENPFKISSE